MKLMPHQQRAVDRNGSHELWCWATRTGKTLPACIWSNHHDRNSNPYILCLKKDKKPWQKAAPHATVLTKEEFKKQWDDIADPSCVVIDECFVAGTKVLTASGYKNIEDIKLGDYVVNALGVSKVDECGSRNVDEIIIIKLSNGISLKVSKNHPFLTRHGWVLAKELHESDELMHYLRVHDIINTYGVYKIRRWNKAMSMLPQKFHTRTSRPSNMLDTLLKETVYSKQVYKNGQKITEKILSNLQSKMRCKQDNIQCKKQILQCKMQRHCNEQKTTTASRQREISQNVFRKNEEKQSDVQRRVSKKNERNTTQNRTQTSSTWWKWKRNASTATYFISCSWKRLVRRTCRAYKKEAAISRALQDRCGASKEKNCNRNRRLFTSTKNTSRTRCSKRQTTDRVWVESITVQKQPDTRVYNIGVAGHPSYVVGDVVVHNSHWAHGQLFVAKLRSKQSEVVYRFIKKWPKMHVLLTTATPVRNDPSSLHTALCFIGKYIPWKDWQDEMYELTYKPYLPRPAWMPKVDWRDRCKPYLEKYADIVKLADVVDYLPPETHEIIEVKTTPYEYEEDEEVRWTTEHQHEQLEKHKAIKELGDKYRKIIIISHYTATTEHYVAKLGTTKPTYVLNGKTKNQQEVIEQAQKADDCYFIVQSSMASGFDGWMFDAMVFTAMSHKVVDYIQAIGRLHHTQHVKPSIYYYLLAKYPKGSSWDRDVYASIKAGKDFYATAGTTKKNES